MVANEKVIVEVEVEVETIEGEAETDLDHQEDENDHVHQGEMDEGDHPRNTDEEDVHPVMENLDQDRPEIVGIIEEEMQAEHLPDAPIEVRVDLRHVGVPEGAEHHQEVDRNHKIVSKIATY